MIRRLSMLALVAQVALSLAALSLPAQATPLSQSIAQKRLCDAKAAQTPANPGGKDGATTGQRQQSRPRDGQGLRTPPLSAP